MQAKLGDLAALKAIRDSLIQDKESEDRNRQRLEQERWESFQKTARGIVDSVESQSLPDLVASVRKMKNLLRRPSVKKDLARMEASEPDKEEKKKGSCKCSKCGKTIDGYNDCIKGALCVKCAMKERDVVPGEKEQDKSEKEAKKGVAFPPEMIAPGGMPGETAPGEEEVPPENGEEEGEEGEEEQPDHVVQNTLKKVRGKFGSETPDEGPKSRKKLRKKGSAAQGEEREQDPEFRRSRDGLRKRNYEKWQL
jgi:hypothetical protein